MKNSYLGNVAFDFPKKFKDNSETKLVEIAPAGIALGFYEESKSFFTNLKEGKIKLEHIGFSFVLA